MGDTLGALVFVAVGRGVPVVACAALDGAGTAVGRAVLDGSGAAVTGRGVSVMNCATATRRGISVGGRTPATEFGTPDLDNVAPMVRDAFGAAGGRGAEGNAGKACQAAPGVSLGIVSGDSTFLDRITV